MMPSSPLHPLSLGLTPLQFNHASAAGHYVEFEGDTYYKISDFDQMPPFFMTIVSDADHWMFLSSQGGVTAGRKNPENAFFPYMTDDKIHDASWNTGSRTVIIVKKNGNQILWEPLGDRHHGVYAVGRNLYKNIAGNQIIFEEINFDLQLTFQYGWFNSRRFGFVKKSKITNTGPQPVTLHLLDGIQNILPAGVSRTLQTHSSTLVDAYKKNELWTDQGIAVYSLSSIPVDRAEPSEALSATVVWSLTPFASRQFLLSSSQLNLFRTGRDVHQETDIRAMPGAYFVNAEFELAQGDINHWITVLDGNQSISDIVALQDSIKNNSSLWTDINADIERGTAGLVQRVASADGLQLTDDKLSSSRHFSNVLFNIMRGGIFDHHDDIEKTDLMEFCQNTNTAVFAQHANTLAAWPACLPHAEMTARASQTGDPNFERICLEYLPLTFSRRHGDPSRPWNTFSIEIQRNDGSKILNYQGNWRDIFQNWEALSLSYPAFVGSMICKFVNASTADGYNPYRVTRQGFEWELLDLEDPWSQIGYWGDHQIIYLLKLLEVSHRYKPRQLDDFLVRDIFSYANVPYRIRPYADLLADPHNTIVFDASVHALTRERCQSLGSDGQLLWTHNGNIYLVNLAEKMLLTILTKFSNFIPEAGIWMNTQRPEWNDANNALVGHGVSMVTLYYLRRFMVFLQQLLEQSSHVNLVLSVELHEFLKNIESAFQTYRSHLVGPFDATDRKGLLDLLGKAGECYRSQLYTRGFLGLRQEIASTDIIDFCKMALLYLDHSIAANERDDHLYHAYNLMVLHSDSKNKNTAIDIHPLYEMLEGQVALINSGYLNAAETLDLLHAMRQSLLFRADQNSYMLYPNRQLPLFADRNNIPVQMVQQSLLLQKLLDAGDQNVIIKDIHDAYHFHSSFRNVTWLRQALGRLQDTVFADLARAEADKVCAIYESVFHHQSFTGRSGTFYKYEGLGCIYWHMVAKLLPAIQEIYFEAVASGQDSATLEGLSQAYYDIRAGLGVHKTPQHYGAFPTDPYSHTPGHLGVQQPGMTGQVKEDIISRWGELGVFVQNGHIRFYPALLQPSEFLTTPQVFDYEDIRGQGQAEPLSVGTLAFTYCQVPIIYHLAKLDQMVLTHADGTVTTLTGLVLDGETSSWVFNRTGHIAKIDVYLQRGAR